MGEAATTTSAATGTAGAPSTAATGSGGAALGSAGATLTSVPTPPEWAGGFKEETKSYVAQKGFKTPEALAESYKHLEHRLSSLPPENRTIHLPEKMEGDAMKGVFEKLGTPKDVKGYEFQRGEGVNGEFMDFAEGAFLKNNLTKNQAQGVVKAYQEYEQSMMKVQGEQLANSLKQADVNLQKEWGQHYESNLNLAKQGAKILGLDGKTLDLMERSQGREALFKTLQKIGVSVGESNFVDGQAGSQTTQLSAEQATAEIKALMQDRKFVKQINSGKKEAIDRWNELNKLAAPGEKSIG